MIAGKIQLNKNSEKSSNFSSNDDGKSIVSNLSGIIKSP
jgi:hypothetical protein